MSISDKGCPLQAGYLGSGKALIPLATERTWFASHKPGKLHRWLLAAARIAGCQNQATAIRWRCSQLWQPGLCLRSGV